MRGLLGVADVKLDVIRSLQREEIGLRGGGISVFVGGPGSFDRSCFHRT